jgi:hypothetical protein
MSRANVTSPRYNAPLALALFGPVSCLAGYFPPIEKFGRENQVVKTCFLQWPSPNVLHPLWQII